MTDHETNAFLAAKAAVVGAATAFTVAFGWMGWLIVTWLAAMAADYVAGSLNALHKGEWSSHCARNGLFHKGGMIFVVCVSLLCGIAARALTQQLGVVLPLDLGAAIPACTLAWYILTESGSILENAIEMGAPCPQFLQNALAVMQAKIEDVIANIMDE